MNRTHEHEALKRNIMLDCSNVTNASLYANDVGEGFHQRVLPMLEQELSRKHPVAWRIVKSVLYRHRVHYGLGVGSPDLVGHVNGKFVGGEIKTGNARVSPKQRKWHEVARAKGALIGVWSSVEEARAFLEGIGQ